MRFVRHGGSRSVVVVMVATAVTVALGAGGATGAATEVWSGTSAGGVHVHFHTNANHTRILPGMLMAIPGVLCLYQGQGAATGAFQMTTSKAIAVKGGRFSSSQPGVPDQQYGTYTLKISGRFSGPSASANVTWSLKNSGQLTCSPTSGHFIWKAFRSNGT